MSPRSSNKSLENSQLYTEEGKSDTKKAAFYMTGGREAVATALMVAYMDGMEAGQRLAGMEMK